MDRPSLFDVCLILEFVAYAWILRRVERVCEMNASLRAWQNFNLSLHVSPGRAVYSTCNPFLDVSKQSLTGFGGRHDSFKRGSRYPIAGASFGSTHIISCGSNSLTWQSRRGTFWRRPTEKKTPAKADVGTKLSVSPTDVGRVFGRNMDPERGVEVLTTLQRHRSQGTLDHELPYSKIVVAKGLAYLRNVYPIDEDAAIIARIDRETTRLPQLNIEHSHQAVSQFDQLRQDNQKRHRLEKTKREVEENKKLERKGRVMTEALSLRAERTTAASNKWVQNYRQQATNHDRDKTRISTWARLLPSATVTVAVVALSILLAQNYTPPSRSARLWPDIPPAAATIIPLIGLNCLVFGLWRIPPLWKFMNRNFLVVPVYPYSMSMLGASFSHQHFTHLMANVLALWLVGTRGKSHTA